MVIFRAVIDYEKTYRSFTERKLLDVLDRPQNYQPEAVEAARRELAAREVDQATISEQLAEREAVRTVQAAAEAEKIRSKGAKNRSRYTVTRPGILDAPEVVSNYTPFSWWAVRLSAVLMGLISAYQLFTAYSLQLYEPYMWIPEQIGYSLLFLVTLLICVAATLLLWFRQKAGWVLTIAFLSFCLAAVLSGLVNELLRDDSRSADLEGLIDLNTRPDTLPMLVIGTLVYSLPLWALSRNSVRTALSITRSTAGWTYYACAMIGLIILYFQHVY